MSDTIINIDIHKDTMKEYMNDKLRLSCSHKKKIWKILKKKLIWNIYKCKIQFYESIKLTK